MSDKETQQQLQYQLQQSRKQQLEQRHPEQPEEEKNDREASNSNDEFSDHFDEEQNDPEYVNEDMNTTQDDYELGSDDEVVPYGEAEKERFTDEGDIDKTFYEWPQIIEIDR